MISAHTLLRTPIMWTVPNTLSRGCRQRSIVSLWSAGRNSRFRARPLNTSKTVQYRGLSWHISSDVIFTTGRVKLTYEISVIRNYTIRWKRISEILFWEMLHSWCVYIEDGANLISQWYFSHLTLSTSVKFI